MRKHLVILLGRYKPNPSPGSVILQKLVDEWKDKYEISIVAIRDDKKLLEYENIGGVDVYRVIEKNRYFHNTLLNKIRKSRNTISKSWYKLLLLLKKGAFTLSKVFRKESLSKPYIKHLLKKLTEINNAKKIDCVISSVDPHETSAATYVFKQKTNVKWLIYQLDRFANANSLYVNKFDRLIKEKRHYKREINYLKTCDKLFILNPLKEHYAQACFNKFSHKVIVTDHPLMEKPKMLIKGADSNEIRLIYGGSLDKKLRNPSVMLDILAQVAKDINIKFNIYSFGNCENLVNKVEKITNGAIANHGVIPYETLVEKISQTDVLVNIGNKSSNELPSKFFGYLSYGLPIIHFYFSDEDAILSYLKRYPMSLCVKLDEEDVALKVETIVNFLKDAKGKVFSFEDIEGNYIECTPKYVANLIGEYI